MRSITLDLLKVVITLFLLSNISLKGNTQSTTQTDGKSLQSVNLHNAITLVFDKDLIFDMDIKLKEGAIPFYVDDAEFKSIMKKGVVLSDDDQSLELISEEEIQYQRLEIIESNTNKLITSKDIDTKEPKVELSGISPGNYTLILSNDKGNILIENISIARN